jgi:two-component system, sensor histidine kinase
MEADNNLEPDLISDEQINVAIEQRTKLDFQQHSKLGGFFYLAGFAGVVFVESTLNIFSPPIIGFGLALLLIASLRLRIATLANQGHQFSKQMISAVLITNVLIWSLFFCWVIYKTRVMDATLSLAIGANSAYAAGIMVATTGMRKLQRKVLIALFWPPIACFAIFMGNNVAFACILALLIYYFFLNNLGKTQNIIHRNALGTLIRLDNQSKALREARNEALAASKAKSDFLSQMSHEIRTPLNGVIGASELLASSTHDPQLQGYVKTIQNSGELLMGLLNNILDFSRISSQAMTISVESVDITELAKGLLAMIQPMAERKGIKLQYQGDTNMPDFIQVDRLRLQQVITNFLTNALKFTKSGSITLQLKISKKHQDELLLHCDVVDTGIGIAKDNLSRVFEQFTQVDSFHSEIRGAGLGLNICKQLVTLMGGELGVTSEPSVGSIFWFEIPVARSESKPLTTPPQKAPTVLQQPITNDSYKPLSIGTPQILVAEDNAVNQKVILQFLQRFDVEVHLASNGQEAVEIFLSMQPDLVLMDFNMPVLDGLSATVKIRELERERGWLRTPVVALTAHAFQDSIKLCLDAGMDDHLSKPMRLVDCANMIDKWVYQRKQP